jgi:hypothetical protein
MCRAESDGIVAQEAVKYDVNNTCSDALHSVQLSQIMINFISQKFSYVLQVIFDTNNT